MSEPMNDQASEQALPIFHRPYPWPDIDAAVSGAGDGAGGGGAILSRFIEPESREILNQQIDDYLLANDRAGRAETGSTSYDTFLGARTLRLHGLIDKVPATADLIGSPDLIDWANRLVCPTSGSVTLNAGELIEIQPDEPKQAAHRDSDSWPEVSTGQNPIVVNAIVALDPFTLTNGATYVAPGSWCWDRPRRAGELDYVRAVMSAGDALLFRGDLIHRGGENRSDRPRRALSISYCAGWLRPVENSFLNLSMATVAHLGPELQAVLGYRSHDGMGNGGGLLGLYENGDPARALHGQDRTRP